MLQANRFSLKEWAVVVRALMTGRQLILLRKGGIEEEDGAFRVKHREFFFYPTFEHQHRKFIRPEFLELFDQSIREQPAGEDFIISGYGQVCDCLIAKELDILRRLSPFHVWNDDYLRMRFEYKPELPLYVLLLRAYHISPVQMTFRLEYRGCKSWVELDRELPTEGVQLALPFAEFERRRQEIREILGLPPVKFTPAEKASHSDLDAALGVIGAALEILSDDD